MVTNVSRSPRRALILADQPLVVELIGLTLNHGEFLTRAATTLESANAIAAEWQPHVALVDMDLEAEGLLRQLALRQSENRRAFPFWR